MLLLLLILAKYRLVVLTRLLLRLVCRLCNGLLQGVCVGVVGGTFTSWRLVLLSLTRSVATGHLLSGVSEGIGHVVTTAIGHDNT